MLQAQFWHKWEPWLYSKSEGARGANAQALTRVVAKPAVPQQAQSHFPELLLVATKGCSPSEGLPLWGLAALDSHFSDRPPTPVQEGILHPFKVGRGRRSLCVWKASPPPHLKAPAPFDQLVGGRVGSKDLPIAYPLAVLEGQGLFPSLKWGN